LAFASSAVSARIRPDFLSQLLNAAALSRASLLLSMFFPSPLLIVFSPPTLSTCVPCVFAHSANLSSFPLPLPQSVHLPRHKCAQKLFSVRANCTILCFAAPRMLSLFLCSPSVETNLFLSFCAHPGRLHVSNPLPAFFSFNWVFRGLWGLHLLPWLLQFLRSGFLSLWMVLWPLIAVTIFARARSFSVSPSFHDLHLPAFNSANACFFFLTFLEDLCFFPPDPSSSLFLFSRCFGSGTCRGSVIFFHYNGVPFSCRSWTSFFFLWFCSVLLFIVWSHFVFAPLRYTVCWHCTTFFLDSV